MLECKTCGCIKDESEFYVNLAIKRGYMYKCNVCYNRYKKERLAAKNLTPTEQFHICYTRSPEKYILSQIRASAKARNLEFNLTIEDIVIPEICPILKTPIVIDRNIKNNMYCPSVDRIDNDLGYIKGNVMIISRLANIMKSNASLEELINFSKYFLENYKNKF